MSLSPQASNLIFISPKLLCNANCSIFRARRVAGAHFQCTGHRTGNSLSLRSASCHAGVEVSHGMRSRAPFLRACLCSASSAKEKKETWQALIPSAWMCCDRLQAQALRAVCADILGHLLLLQHEPPVSISWAASCTDCGLPEQWDAQITSAVESQFFGILSQCINCGTLWSDSSICTARVKTLHVSCIFLLAIANELAPAFPHSSEIASWREW